MAWLYLMAAILTEVVGTTAMNASADADNVLGIAVTIGLICVSYVLLSFAVRTIPIAVAFAVWEGLGLTLVTIASVVIFNEPLPLPALLGVGGVLAGIFLLEQGITGPGSGHEEVAPTEAGPAADGKP
jgi:spermidine export protein MdtJ